MALTNVQRRTAVTSVAATTITATFSPAPLAGNLLVANAAASVVLAMTSAGWTLAGKSEITVGTYQWYKIAGPSEPTTVQITGSSGNMELCAEEWSGNNQSFWVLDRAATGSAGSGATVVPSGTTDPTVQPDELAIACFGWNDTGATATANSYTNSFAEVVELKGLGGVATNLAVAERALTTVGATTTSVTLSAGPTSSKGAVIGTYKAATFLNAYTRARMRYRVS